jgi:excisionase family DNA binding protein
MPVSSSSRFSTVWTLLTTDFRNGHGNLEDTHPTTAQRAMACGSAGRPTMTLSGKPGWSGKRMKLDEFEIEAIADAVARRLTVNGNGHATSLSPRLLTVEKAAGYLGRTKDAVQHMVAAGKIPTVRADRRVFVDVRDLDRWIEDNKNASA